MLLVGRRGEDAARRSAWPHSFLQVLISGGLNSFVLQVQILRGLQMRFAQVFILRCLAAGAVSAKELVKEKLRREIRRTWFIRKSGFCLARQVRIGIFLQSHKRKTDPSLRLVARDDDSGRIVVFGEGYQPISRRSRTELA